MPAVDPAGERGLLLLGDEPELRPLVQARAHVLVGQRGDRGVARDLRDEVGARNRIELAAWAGRQGLYATRGERTSL